MYSIQRTDNHLKPTRCNQSQFRDPPPPEENWTVFHKTVHSSAATTLGHPSRKHHYWFVENGGRIQKLLEDKHRLHKAHQDDTSSVSKKAAYSNICKTVQTKLRDMHDSWLRYMYSMLRERV